MPGGPASSILASQDAQESPWDGLTGVPAETHTKLAKLRSSLCRNLSVTSSVEVLDRDTFKRLLADAKEHEQSHAHGHEGQKDAFERRTDGDYIIKVDQATPIVVDRR